jgi:hypothetical protein
VRILTLRFSKLINPFWVCDLGTDLVYCAHSVIANNFLENTQQAGNIFLPQTQPVLQQACQFIEEGHWLQSPRKENRRCDDIVVSYP